MTISFRSTLALLGTVTALLLAPTQAADGAPKKAPKAARPRYADTLIPSIKPTRLVPYKRVGERELKLHVFLPSGWRASDRRPAFVAIHGGGWGGGDATRMYPFTDYFARQGLVAISIEYRLIKPGSGVTVFDCVQDGRSAIRYVRAHAAELGIDPARIIANGGSAGGHVAVATALFSAFDDPAEDRRVSAEPNALVLYYPVIDTSKEGYGNAKIGARWRELSPAHNVRPGLPPTIVFHGTGDATTPFKGAQLFVDEMHKAGNRIEFDVNQGGGHGYLLVTRALFEDTLAKTERFLRNVRMWPTTP
jgi:acetyl esterase/lipase